MKEQGMAVGKELISVIIPVYNVADYLHRCLNSVLSQTYCDLEIWLVDDGSTDGCDKICDEYAEYDSRIHVIHKENGGLSDARNVALEEATGAYIVFIDSDDYVSAKYIENLYNAVSEGEADIAVSGFKEVFSDADENVFSKGTKKIGIYNNKDALQKMLYQDEIETCAWGKIYKRELFSNIRYPYGKLYEDICTTYKLFIKANKISSIKSIDYAYVQRRDSIQNRKFNKKKLDAIENVIAMKKDICAIYPELEKAAQCRMYSTLCNILFQVDADDYETIKNVWIKLKKIRWNVIKNPKARKKNRIGALVSFAGYRIMRKIYNLTQWRARM